MIFSPIALAIVIASTMTMIIFGYMSKNYQRNTQAKARRIVRLRERARKLDNIIFSLPATYLPKTLKVLIYASIVDSLRQMHSLSGNDDINRQIERVTQTLSTLVELEPSSAVSANLDSNLELKEFKYLLKDLYSLILEFHSEGSLVKNTTHAHLEIVKSLMLKVTLDTYRAAANTALLDNNLGLARHYNLMALNRLSQDHVIERFEEEKVYFTEQVSSLDLKIQDCAGLHRQQDSSKEAVQAEWEALESATDDDWKKKRY
ncbi:MAG: hypothetical protein ACJA2Q_000219 [Pseudohongiellaceae bacterium]|jgi:hypothetical protein